MAHDRKPPPGYVECFRPNLFVTPAGVLTIGRRAIDLSADEIRVCEDRFRVAGAPLSARAHALPQHGHTGVRWRLAARRRAARKSRRYWLTRFLVLRVLGLVYVAAFASLAWQVLPLVGEHGLLPAARFLERIHAGLGSRLAAFLEFPSVFWLERVRSDAARRGAARARALAAGSVRLRECAPARRALGAPALGRADRPALVRLRLGDPARRDGLPVHLPVPAHVGASVRAAARRLSR